LLPLRDMSTFTPSTSRVLCATRIYLLPPRRRRLATLVLAAGIGVACGWLLHSVLGAADRAIIVSLALLAGMSSLWSP
jgi:hypothetical protein